MTFTGPLSKYEPPDEPAERYVFVTCSDCEGKGGGGMVCCDACSGFGRILIYTRPKETK